MAKKNPVKPVEPESSEEETDASSDEEEPQTTLKSNNTISKKLSTQPDSSEEEESESDADSEPTPSPITSKRPAASEANKSENAKKPKTHNNVAVDNTSNKIVEKKNSFQRVFSDDDEIVILNGMIEFEAEKKMSPSAGMDAFLEFIKNNLHVDVTKKQLQGKIQKMRKRYENNKEKDRSSAKPHDKTVFELSDKLWGGHRVKEANGSVVTRNVSKKTENGKKEAAVEVVSNGAVGSYIGLSNEEKLLRLGVELFGREDKIAGWQEWKKLEREEMELTVKQLDVKRAKMRLVLDTVVE